MNGIDASWAPAPEWLSHPAARRLVSPSPGRGNRAGHWLAGLLILAFLLSGAALQLWAQRGASGKRETGAEAKKADWFLFVRATGGDQPRTALIQGWPTSSGFELRELYAIDKLENEWRPLGVVAGKVYLMHHRKLLCIDPETRKAENLGAIDYWSEREMCDLVGERLYLLMSDAHTSGTLRVCDLRRQAFRDISGVPLPSWSYLFKIAVSPDQARAACWTPPGPAVGKGLPSGWLLHVIDLQSGEVSHPLAPIRFSGPPLGNALGSPPFTWLDGRTILCQIERRLAMVDVVSGATEDVIDLPGERGQLQAHVVLSVEDGVPRVALAASRAQPWEGRYRST